MSEESVVIGLTCRCVCALLVAWPQRSDLPHAELLCPANTVMDMNIGSALWLAAKAEGPTRLFGQTEAATRVKDGTVYRSTSRIVLLGTETTSTTSFYTQLVPSQMLLTS